MDGIEAWTKSLKINSMASKKKRPQHHHYTLSQFGLEADQIRERFSSYIENYDLSSVYC